MSNRFLGPRITRVRDAGLTGKEKISIYLFACAFIIPVIVLTRSPHLRIFLIVLLVVKGIVFLRMKTSPAGTEKPAAVRLSSVFPAVPAKLDPQPDD
jgi:uncharacterized membrane protein YbaN (DUF454 family)